MASSTYSMILLIRTPKEYHMEEGCSLKLTTTSPPLRRHTCSTHLPMNKETKKTCSIIKFSNSPQGHTGKEKNNQN